MRILSRAHTVRGVLVASKVVRWVSILAVCYLGGVAATNLAPTTVETPNYAATIRLTPLPSRVGVLHSPTIVGDVDLEFRSPVLSPGIEVDLAVKQSITQVFSSRQLSIDQLQPSQADLRSALEDAVRGVGLRFATGAAVVGLAILLALHYSRHRHRSDKRHVAVVTSAALVGCLATAAGVATTYQPGAFSSYRTSGLLLEVERNRAMLSDLSARSSQVTPYVLNLLAISKSLQENLVPSNLDNEVAARFLLVSDIHGQNSYGLMRSIVQSQHIDAVIDTGDLVNFGTVAEADAAGMFTGIRDLGVPYIVTTGNHDQSSPSDRALRDRLNDVPNVITLQPGDDAYRTLLFHGLRIAGFDDPRYFGDDARNTDEKQKPAVDAFNRSMADQPTPDVVVAHEPGAAAGVDKADVRINGHLHQAGLDGDRITVGTFTGGGVVSHYVEEPSGELRGQPYAFDIAAFDTSCKLSSLTRYEYRNLVEGDPVYDSVTVVNGSTIETASPGKDPQTGEARACTSNDANQEIAVPLVPERTPADGATTGG